MSFLFLSKRAWEACERCTSPRFYFDLRRYRDAHERGSFPFTPALPIVFALDVALDFMLAETPAGVYARHARVAARTRDRVRGEGLQLFAPAASASSTVTAIRVPDGVDEPSLIERLRTDYDTVLARGQERLRGTIVRLGHLGWVEEEDVDRAVDALRDALAGPGVTAS
jgi:aspartate aminotransferase-like enzyme